VADGFLETGLTESDASMGPLSAGDFARFTSRSALVVTVRAAPASNLYGVRPALPVVQPKEPVEDAMAFFYSPPFTSARSLAAAGLLVVLAGCGTTSFPPPGPPATSARSAGGSPVPPVMAEPLAVGAKAPAFTLNDQKGEERTLEDFLTKGKVALVFYRSARW
jgi:hypothetical protein